MLNEMIQIQNLFSVLFHLYKIPKVTKLWKWRRDWWLPGVKEGVEAGGKWV